MRIGQVSKKYDIPVDSLYYYINLGLIVPKRPGGQYVFDEKCLEDLELVLRLKKMAFPLKEIHKVLSILRISSFVDSQDLQDLATVFKNRQNELMDEKRKLDEAIKEIQDELNRLVVRVPQKTETTGVPVTALQYLTCPQCQSSLALHNVQMNQRYIYSGEMNCQCGFEALIKDGILLTGNINTSQYDRPDLKRELYKDLPPALISLFQKSYNWMTDKLQQMKLKGKVVLETHVNAYFFMQQHLSLLDPDGLYIIIDKFPETLQMYKQLIQKQRPDLDFLYIADCSTQYPLKKGCVDLFVDYFGSNEHMIYNHTWLISEFGSFLAPGAEVLGTFFCFEGGTKSIKKLLEEYPEAYERNFLEKHYFQSLKENGFTILGREDAGWTDSSGDNLAFSFHVDGERMHLIPFLAECPAAPNVQDAAPQPGHGR